jgi:hypothetical protein
MKITKVATVEMETRDLHIIRDALRVAATNAEEDGNYAASEYDKLNDELDSE